MIEPAILIDPLGELQASYFPDDTPAQLTDRLQAYIDAAYLDPAISALTSTEDQDEAAIAYTYRRSYKTIAGRLASTPSSASLQGLGSMSISASQIEFFNTRALFWDEQFMTATIVVDEVRGVSGPVRNSYVW
jgi:hypothetical protein